MKTTLLALFVLLSLTSFTSNKKFTIETKPGETILIGKLDIYNKGQLKNKDISFQIRNIQTGSKHKIKLDNEGYFITKVPVGFYEIKQVYYKDKYIKLPHGYLTVKANDPKSVFYIGNIYINWSPLHYDRNRSPYFMIGMGVGFGIIGVAAAGAINSLTESNVDLMPAIVREKATTTERFLKFYPRNNKEIISQPINIYVYENEKTR